MKKMKFVTKGLALLMMGVMLAGCSDKATEPSESSKQESVSESNSSVASSSEAASSEATSSEAASSEATSSEATSSEAPTIDDSISASTENAIGGQGQTIDVDDSRVAEYEAYFKGMTMEGKLFSMHFEGEEDGVKLNFDMKFGTKDGDSLLYIGMAGQGDANSLTAYFMKDNTAYMELKVAGSDPVAQKTTDMDSETAEQLNPGSSLVDFGAEGEEEVKLTYVGEETIDGVVYDVLKPTDSDEAYIYMNQKTKEWEKMKAMSEGQEIMVDILPMDAISLPASLANAEEVDAESFTMSLAFGMLGLMAGGQ